MPRINSGENLKGHVTWCSEWVATVNGTRNKVEKWVASGRDDVLGATRVQTRASGVDLMIGRSRARKQKMWVNPDAALTNESTAEYILIRRPSRFSAQQLPIAHDCVARNENTSISSSLLTRTLSA